MLEVVLKCTVCKEGFTTKKQWLHHLLLDSHQEKARVGILNWEVKERDSLLVVYSTFPVACEDVLYHFSGVKNKILMGRPVEGLVFNFVLSGSSQHRVVSIQ